MNKFNELIDKSHHKIAFAILLIGVGSGFFSFLLHELTHSISQLIGTNQSFTLETFFYATAFALASYYLTKKLFKDTSGSGIPQVKLSLVAYKGKMPKRMSGGKFITTVLTLCSGLSFGKEGPMITIGAAWGHLVSHMLNFNRQITKVLVSSGSAAGLAAAFNTPIAAVVFTIEEILGELNTKYLGPIIVTSVIASVTSFKLLGNKSTFITLNYEFHIEWHLLLYLLLGLTMSLIGMAFIKSILFFKEIKKRYFKRYDFLYIVLIVILAGVSSLFSPEILGDGIETINVLLAGKAPPIISAFAFLFILKLALSTTSYSTGLSGGLFMPVLFLGALAGTIFGLFLQKFGIAKIEIGVFALLGMTSLLVAVIKTPFTAFVMLFEMTRDYELILPLMISSIVAYWFSSFFNIESAYEAVAKYEGVNLPTQQDSECLNEMVVEECMIKDVITLKGNDRIMDVIGLVQSSKFGGFPVLRNNRLIGVVNKCDIEEAFKTDPEAKIRSMAKYSVITIFPDQSLLVALDKMKRFEIGRLPVVSRFHDKQLLGIITPEDIVNYLGLSKQEL